MNGRGDQLSAFQLNRYKKNEKEREREKQAQIDDQIFGNFGAVISGLFRSIKRFPSAL